MRARLATLFPYRDIPRAGIPRGPELPALDVAAPANGLLLEYSYLKREFNKDDGIMQPRFEMSFGEASPINDFREE